MTTYEIPELDSEALGMAGMAFIHSPGPTDSRRVRDAVTAYLYVMAAATEADGWRLYPSWGEVRDAVAQARASHDENRRRAEAES